MVSHIDWSFLLLGSEERECALSRCLVGPAARGRREECVQQNLEWEKQKFDITKQVSVKVTYLGIRSAHERVWLVERKPIWLPRAYLTRGDLEPARGNLHACKFLQDLKNIQIRTVTAERVGFVLGALPDERVTTQRRKEGRREPEGERERRQEGERGRK